MTYRYGGHWGPLVYALGLLFLADVQLLVGGLALGEGITVPLSVRKSFRLSPGFAYPAAEPPALDAPDPVEPSAKRRAATEK